MIDIPEFSNNRYCNGKVFNIKTGKEVPLQELRCCFKLKHNTRGWINVTLSKVKALCGFVLNLPNCSKPIPFTGGEYYIDSNANVYSFSYQNPQGLKLKPNIGTKGYFNVCLKFKGKTTVKDVHQLMARTFIMEDYVEKGLVCLHEDDDKTNCNLSNLSVGTYSKNNKDAYKTGVNKGKGLKKL